MAWSQDLPHLCLTVKGYPKVRNYWPKSSQHINCIYMINFISALDIVTKSQFDSLISLLC